MARCIFEGLTFKQAKILASWFEGQGEQDCTVWFEDRNVQSPTTDVARKGGYKEVDREKEEVKVYCK